MLSVKVWTHVTFRRCRAVAGASSRLLLFIFPERNCDGTGSFLNLITQDGAGSDILGIVRLRIGNTLSARERVQAIVAALLRVRGALLLFQASRAFGRCISFSFNTLKGGYRPVSIPSGLS
jgi:hypothetical protein